MNPVVLFWVPAILRLSLVFVAGGVAGYFFGPLFALLAVILVLVVMLLAQLQYLYLLSNWLNSPSSSHLPDGWGAWTEIFARLYKMRREDERHQAELTEWLARFRQAMGMLPDGVVIMDDVLRLEWCNRAAETHLGLSRERDEGRRVTNLVRTPEFMDYLILGRFEQPVAFAFRDRKLLAQIIPFESRRQILVTQDMTESERIDMLRRDFIANASHELRTPLTVINGFLEIACSQPELDTQTRSSHLNMMLEQGRRMQNLVEDMLTLTRLESADFPIRMEQVRMDLLLKQLLDEGQALSGGRHVITLARADGSDLKGNYDELRSAFSNLVSNAIRYTPDGGAIAVSWSRTDDGATFAVKDSGIGIQPEHIPRLTERFYRVDKSRSRESRGTGLGLAIVKHVLLRHGATLMIESRPGQGSIFMAKFPAAATWVGEAA